MKIVSEAGDTDDVERGSACPAVHVDDGFWIRSRERGQSGDEFLALVPEDRV